MAPVLPSSLSPHICILSSPDLTELLESSNLPPLFQILQSFSPLPQVTTRTTSLASVPHTSFALRFSELAEIEEACLESEDQRAVRTIDWMSSRINSRCARWVQDMEKLGDKDKDSFRTPWWDELRRCTEGDHIPSKTEGWNHPIAVILAVSTVAPNPLHTITALHARPLQFPSWVDSTMIRYTLIIHPQNSPFSDEEAGALFNAVKKQFGLHSYLLPLSLPMPPPAPIPVPALIPRLPRVSNQESPVHHRAPSDNRPASPSTLSTLNTLRMDEKDIKQTARFTREFVVMSLVPWMEKCVVEWNESFSSTRRLPSRLFSSTRRLFGTPSPSPTLAHNMSSSISSLQGRTSISSTVNGSVLTPPSQQRRLAEFATILGDFKLAITVWEALRKDSKGGSDILPLLLAPSPALQLHASNAITNICPPATEVPPHAQLTALLYGVRWEAAIPTTELLSSTLEGERWLVWAAGNAEEAPSALLLAHAALLSARKHARRRAALLYVSAANRLEKCGIKPLTMYFLRRAQELYNIRIPNSLSPLFWESEGKSPTQIEGFDAIMPGIEHPLGRLLYTTGDISTAVKIFLGLLRSTSSQSMSLSTKDVALDGDSKASETDKVFLDDFRVAFAHFKATEPASASTTDLKLPFKFCLPKQTKLRFPDDSGRGEFSVWDQRKDNWKAFWKSQGGKEGFAQSSSVSTGELFWVDLMLRNPLDTEVNLSNLTLVVQSADTKDSSSSDLFVEVELIEDVVLGPLESRTIPISLMSKQPSSLTITHAKYEFLSLLSSTEPLVSRGRRLHDTPAQRQKPTYAADSLMKVDVMQTSHKLLVNYVDDDQLLLTQGENRPLRLWLSNVGSRPIGEIWMVSGVDDDIYVGENDDINNRGNTDDVEIIQSHNSTASQPPRRLPIHGTDGSAILHPEANEEVSIVLHGENIGEQELYLLFVYRETSTDQFNFVRLARSYNVEKLFNVSVSAVPSSLVDSPYMLKLDISNVASSTPVTLAQLTTLSPQWNCKSLSDTRQWLVLNSQSIQVFIGANRWSNGSGSKETVDFISQKLRDVLHGKDITSSKPPAIDLACSHILGSSRIWSMQSPAIQALIHNGRRKYASHTAIRVHPYIPPASHSKIFPLYNPASVDLVVFWEVPTQHRWGHINIYGLVLGAGHGALDHVIQDAESAKMKRSMYAETRRENMEVLDAIRASEWNLEMNPIVVSVQEPGTVSHNFSKGPCHVTITFCLRNHSLTHAAHFALKLGPASPVMPLHSLATLPAPYSGRMTYRGSIEPSQLITLRSKLWITEPGLYSLGGWVVETEVVDPALQEHHPRNLLQYKQEPLPADVVTLTVCDSDI